MAKRYRLDLFSRFFAAAIGTIAPDYARKYLIRRNILARYTGAGTDGPDKPWRPKNQSADALMASDRPLLTARARDLERNSPHVSGAINKICNNIIYTGIFPQARLKKADGMLDKPKNDDIEQAWKDWADEVRFYEKQELVLRHLIVDGEIFVHRFFDPDLYEKRLPPLGLELYELDYLDSTVSGVLANGNVAKAGIEYNRFGKPVAYHFYKDHPGDSLFSKYFGEVRRVLSSEICHVFHPRRASQGRGISWLASIIMEMRDFSEYQSNERIAARLASAFGVFLESPYPEHQINNPLYQPPTEEGADYDPTTPKYIDPGRIDALPPGTKINVAQFTRPGVTYEPFTKIALKSASTGSGISYENFSNDYEGATYSSARQAVLEERRGYRKIQTFINRNFNGWTWRNWKEFADISKFLGNLPDRIPVQWQNPGWPWIDPAKDAKGAEMELAMKLTNRRRLAAERGLDWDEEIEELTEEERIIKEKGLQDYEQTQTDNGGSPDEEN